MPNVRRQGKSITDYEGCFTDLEWGNGLGLYGLYQMARLSGAWDVVRKNWSVVKGAYGLFEMLQDWACMSVSGSEHGRRWTDTSSYGGYVAFREMAKAIGDSEAWEEAVYLHAKHAAMRLALFNNGTFIHRYYAAKPWKVQHSFPENPREFNTAYEPVRFGGHITFKPDDLRGGDLVIQKWSLYSLVGEGTGYECPDMLYALQPEATREFVRLYKQHYPEWPTEAFCKAMNAVHSPAGGITLYQMLLFELRDLAVPTAAILQQFEEVEKADLIRRHLRGFYGRWNAAHEYAHALLETREDPAWLEHWSGGDVLSADYDRATRQATLRWTARGPGQLQLGGAEPRKVELDGRGWPRTAGTEGGWSYEAGRLLIRLPRGGTVAISY